jgi:hypothetical protein
MRLQKYIDEKLESKLEKLCEYVVSQLKKMESICTNIKKSNDIFWDEALEKYNIEDLDAYINSNKNITDDIVRLDSSIYDMIQKIKKK